MRIVVLFNLKPGVDAAEYEDWARNTDLPGVRALRSCTDYQIYRTTGLFGSDATPPYQYIEIIDVAGMEPFLGDVGTEAIQKLAADFQRFADQPLFITTEAL